MRLRLLVLSASLPCVLCGSARASLIGDTITAEFLNNRFDPPVIDSEEVVVGDGIEGLLGREDAFLFDVGAESITLTSAITVGEWTSDLQWRFSDLDWSPIPGEITGVRVTGTGEGWSLMDETDVTFTSDSVLIDGAKIWGFRAALDQSVTIGLLTSHGVPVPEPATMVLLAFGIAGAGLVARRRR